MKPITHAANGREYLLVEVEQGSTNHRLSKCQKYIHIAYDLPNGRISSFAFFYKDFGGKAKYPKDLKIIGVNNELSEEQSAGVVGRSQYDSSVFEMYDTRQLITIHAMQSLHSLIRSHGISNCLILQKI